MAKFACKSKWAYLPALLGAAWVAGLVYDLVTGADAPTTRKNALIGLAAVAGGYGLYKYRHGQVCRIR